MHPPPTETDAVLLQPKNQQSATTDSDTATTAIPYPQEVVDDVTKNEKQIYWSLVLLNCSVIWLYYLCAAVQGFYCGDQFMKSMAPSERFSTLMALHSAWPISLGYFLRLLFQIHNKTHLIFEVAVAVALVTLTVHSRARAGGIDFNFMLLWVIFMCVAQQRKAFDGIAVLLVVGFIRTDFATAGNLMNWVVGISLLLVNGSICSLAEEKGYALAAQLPSDLNFTRAVQIGNGCANILNLAAMTMLGMFVGDRRRQATNDSSEQLVFYLFVAFSIAVFAVAGVVYHKLTKLKCIKYYRCLLLQQHTQGARIHNTGTSVTLSSAENRRGFIKRKARIFVTTWGPAFLHFVVFLAASKVLSELPEFGCTSSPSSLSIDPPNSRRPTLWYCYAGSIGGSLTYADGLVRRLFWIISPCMYMISLAALDSVLPGQRR